jgi:hypothetical protein
MRWARDARDGARAMKSETVICFKKSGWGKPILAREDGP